MAETVSEIGEFGLIDRIHALIAREGYPGASVVLGIGDDTASFLPRAGYEVLVTCDSMVEGRHYLPGRVTPFELGRRGMAMNLSDIGAMGGRPLYALISLGLKPETAVSDVEALYLGFLHELRAFEASVIGGNITGVKSEAFIDITLIGEVEAGRAVRRSTARPGDRILVTGHPGEAAAGFQLLLRADPREALRDDPLIRAYNTPGHRAREGRAVALSGCATAMIDTSDGFLGDLAHICEQSGLGAVVYRDALPLSQALREGAQRLGADPHELFLGASDDYELIITCRPGDEEGLIRAISSIEGVPAAVVGRMSAGEAGITVVSANGTPVPASAGGWDHFRKGGKR
jgi:thiamine-monophosphate kinase